MFFYGLFEFNRKVYIDYIFMLFCYLKKRVWFVVDIIGNFWKLDINKFIDLYRLLEWLILFFIL